MSDNDTYMNTEKTLREHLQAAARARWAKRTPEERKAHGAMMNQAKRRRTEGDSTP